MSQKLKGQSQHDLPALSAFIGTLIPIISWGACHMCQVWSASHNWVASMTTFWYWGQEPRYSDCVAKIRINVYGPSSVSLHLFISNQDAHSSELLELQTSPCLNETINAPGWKNFKHCSEYASWRDIQWTGWRRVPWGQHCCAGCTGLRPICQSNGKWLELLKAMQPRANSSKALSAKPCFRIGLSPPRRGRKHKV